MTEADTTAPCDVVVEDELRRGIPIQWVRGGVKIAEDLSGSLGSLNGRASAVFLRAKRSR